jgi:hypothetical protein
MTPLIVAPERFVSVMVTVTSFSVASGLAHTCLSFNFPSVVFRVTVRGNAPSVRLRVLRGPEPLLNPSGVVSMNRAACTADRVAFLTVEHGLLVLRRLEAKEVAVIRGLHPKEALARAGGEGSSGCRGAAPDRDCDGFLVLSEGALLADVALLAERRQRED